MYKRFVIYDNKCIPMDNPDNSWDCPYLYSIGYNYFNH